MTGRIIIYHHTFLYFFSPAPSPSHVTTPPYTSCTKATPSWACAATAVRHGDSRSTDGIARTQTQLTQHSVD